MTREEAHEYLMEVGAYKAMQVIDKIYNDLETKVCENCVDFHNGYCLLPKIGHRYNRPKTFGCTDFKRENHD